MMNSIKKITILFLSIIFASFIVIMFDNASSIEASGCEGTSTVENVCIVINEAKNLEYTDNIGNVTIYDNAFASLDNLKLEYTSTDTTNVKNIKYRLYYENGSETYYSKWSKYKSFDDKLTIIADVNSIIDNNKDANIEFLPFDKIYVETRFGASVFLLQATIAEYVIETTYKPFNENDITLYSPEGISKYKYTISNYNVYGEIIESDSSVKVNIYRLIGSSSKTLISSSVVKLEDYSHTIVLNKYDGEFLIEVLIDTAGGTVSISRTFTCDFEAPTVFIDDVTTKISSEDVKVSSTGVSNVRVFNLTVSGGDVYYKVLNATLPEPSISNLESDWIKYTGRSAKNLGDIVIGEGLNGKYYLYVVAVDKSDNYSKVNRSNLFIIDNAAPIIEDVLVSLDTVNNEVIVSIESEDISSISAYMARVAYYDSNNEVKYGEWVREERYSFRLSIEGIEAGYPIFVEVYAIDGLGNQNEKLITQSKRVMIESKSMSVSYENINSEYLRNYGEVFSSPIYIRVDGDSVNSIKVNGAEYINNGQICEKIDLSYRCKFSVSGEYSLVVKNSDGSEEIRRTFIINTNDAILVDSEKIVDYKKYFMASVVSENGKFVVTIPNSVYNVEDTLRFIYVASNGSYKHVLENDEKVEVLFKNVELPSYKDSMDIEIPLSEEQFTSLKYSIAYETNYILCYTIETEEVTTVVPENPVTPSEPSTPEVNTPSDDENINNPNDENNTTNDEEIVVTISKNNNSKISTTDMLKLFIVAAAIILFVKIINYRRNVKVI